MASNQSGEREIREWYGGISDDVYEQNYNQFAITKHFDTITSPNRLIPFRSMEAVEDTTFFIKDFNLAGTQGFIYGLGRDTTDVKNKIFSESGGAWSAVANGTATTNTTSIRTMFAEYQNNLYLFQTDTTVAKVIPTTSYTEAFGTLGVAITNSTQGFVHPISDRLFIGYNNRIAQVDGSTFTDAVLILPSSMVITSFCAWGESLAIACRAKDEGRTSSRVYLWNMIDPTPYDMIDWGLEALMVLDNIDNQLVGVSISGVASNTFRQVLYGRSWAGGDVITFKTIDLGDTSSVTYALRARKQAWSGRLYFTLTGSANTAPYIGVWVLGRKNESFPYQMTIAYLVNNDTATTGATAFFKNADLMWVAFGTASVNRTHDTSDFTAATSFMESQIYDGGDTTRQKKLTGVSMTYPKLVGTAVLKYRKDEETSYTQIFSENTNNAMATVTTAVGTTTSLPTFFQIQFKIESTGGCEMMSLRFKYDFVAGAMD